MLKQAAVLAGAAVILTPVGLPLVSCGLPGLLVAGAGFFVADAVMQGILDAQERSAGTEAQKGERRSGDGDDD